MQEALSNRRQIPARLREKVEAGETGRKAGRGFYDWSEGTPKPASDEGPARGYRGPADPADARCLRACLRNGIVGSPEEADAAMIFATGFAPFRGGPMHYARTAGTRRSRLRWSACRGNTGNVSPQIRIGATGAEMVERLDDPETVVDRILALKGHDLRVALPLGLGKPVDLINALTRRAVADPSISLQIFTALTLERPQPGSDMEKRFLEPALDRLFGRYPPLDYARMQHEGSLPANISVTEFFFQAPNWTGVAHAQQNYVSANYTHALDVLVSRKPNLVMQLLAAEDGRAQPVVQHRHHRRSARATAARECGFRLHRHGPSRIALHARQRRSRPLRRSISSWTMTAGA
jgi:hypothetical protein